MDNRENISIIIELLKLNNIHNIVISPGGTNIPFVSEVQEDSFFTCYSVVDERSAIYFAIGLYLQTGEVIATSCTSAQATRNYIPGLTEAFYKRVPILAITMCKHPRFTYQEYMQAPDQASLPCDCVKQSYTLPFISIKEDKLHSVRLVAEAIQATVTGGKGPVQLCVPWLDFDSDNNDVKIKNVNVVDYEKFCSTNISLAAKTIMIAIGEHTKFDVETTSAIDRFCENHNAVIYANHLSNFSNKYTVKANVILNAMEAECFELYKPDILITIGGQTGDYPFYNMFSKGRFDTVEHWRVSEDGKVIDTYDKLTHVFKCTEKAFFNLLKGREGVEHSYYDLWKKLMDEVKVDIDLPFSNASIAQFLCDKIPSSSIIQFSILNSLRIWNFFPLHPSIECYSNVAAFGIDGGMSTLIGQSIVSNELAFMIIGDLAFLYDMNSISIRHIKNNLRIIIINNNGGMEFKYSKIDNEKRNEYIAAGNHYKNAEGWAETCGFEYLNAMSMDEFKECSDKLIKKSERPIVLEAFVSDIDEADAYEALVNANRKMTVSGNIKKEIKSSIIEVIGKENFDKIKNIVKK